MIVTLGIDTILDSFGYLIINKRVDVLGNILTVEMRTDFSIGMALLVAQRFEVRVPGGASSVATDLDF